MKPGRGNHETDVEYARDEKAIEFLGWRTERSNGGIKSQENGAAWDTDEERKLKGCKGGVVG